MTRFSLEDLEEQGLAPVPLPEDPADWEVGKPYELPSGLVCIFEYLRGQVRAKTAPDGAKWEQEMPDAYGYACNTLDRHGEPIDVYASSNPDNGGYHADADAVVIDQVFAGTHDFDEHKIMCGYESAAVAKDTYFAAFGDGKGPERLGALSTVDMSSLEMWLISGDTLVPFSGIDWPGSHVIEDNGVTPVDAPPPTNPDDANVNPSQDQVVDKSGNIQQTGGKKTPQPIVRNGGVVIPLPVVGEGPYIHTTPIEGARGQRHDIFIDGYFCCYDWAVLIDDICRMLVNASEEDKFTFHISSYGGSLDAACRLCSAIRVTKAKVRTVAAGPICSAATFLWAEGHERVIKPGAYFMEHMSSHGDCGNSKNIAFAATMLVKFVATVVMKRMMDIKLYTQEEYDLMMTKGKDIYISAEVAASRLGIEVDMGK